MTPELRQLVSDACLWLAGNIDLWQPFGLLLAVGLLLLAVRIVMEAWA
jgi:hypothetical protein